MNKKLVIGTGAVAAVFVLWACSSDSSNPGVTNEPDAANAETSSNSPTDSAAATDAKPDAVNTQDASFDADSIDAPEVSIEYSANCPAFTKCDSDPIGTWKTTGGCVSTSIFDGAKAQCSGLQESAVVIKAKGILALTATNVSRQAKVTLNAHIQLPKSCSPIADCGLIAIGLKQQNYGGFNTATCTDGGSNCQCDVQKIITDGSADTYTKDGTGTLTTGAGEKYDYCVAANVITYQKQDSAGTKELAVFTAAP